MVHKDLEDPLEHWHPCYNLLSTDHFEKYLST